LQAFFDIYVGSPWCLIGLLLCDHPRCLTPLLDAVFYWPGHCGHPRWSALWLDEAFAR
jgi:hypothetical protein